MTVFYFSTFNSKYFFDGSLLHTAQSTQAHSPAQPTQWLCPRHSLAEFFVFWQEPSWDCGLWRHIKAACQRVLGLAVKSLERHSTGPGFDSPWERIFSLWLKKSPRLSSVPKHLPRPNSHLGNGTVLCMGGTWGSGVFSAWVRRSFSFKSEPARWPLCVHPRVPRGPGTTGAQCLGGG